jgi:hypothetical protein
MQLRRLFSTDSVKGSKGYLDSQKKYEVIRTVLYFGISLSLFVAGYLQTKDKANLLTIVAGMPSRQQERRQRGDVSPIQKLKRSDGGED